MVKSVLEIPWFRVQVLLGCETWEREHSQSVDFKIKIGFKESLAAETSDDLKDAICYAEISSLVVQTATKTEYKLIEKLARDVYEVIKKEIPKTSSLQVQVHKIKPPVDILKSGVLYSLGDLSL